MEKGFKQKGSSSSGGRRQTYVSVNHELLGFEVISRSSSSGVSRPSGGSHGRNRGRHGSVFSKERFFHANFRFLARPETAGRSALEADPDALLDWNNIELVIVPASCEVKCPICLDFPLAPRITRCGHFFCWPCILRYAATSDGTTTKGNPSWRNCPICFEDVNVRQQLKGVHFVAVTDYASNMVEVGEVGIPMVLLQGTTDSAQVTVLNGVSNDTHRHLQQQQQQQQQRQNNPKKTLNDLNPFDKITFVSGDFLIEQVIDVEMRNLHDRLAMMDDSDDDKPFVELCLSMLDDRRSQMMTETVFPSPPSEILSKLETTTNNPSSNANALYFHQSIDGQPFFLCPLSIRMLRRHFGEYSRFPHLLCAPVVEIEMFMMTEELRKRHRYLHHIPLGCQLCLCEVDLGAVVDAKVMEEFSGELQARKEARRVKADRENRQAAKAQRQAEQHLGFAHPGWDDLSSPGIAVSVLGCKAFWDDHENFPYFEAGVRDGKEPSSTIEGESGGGSEPSSSDAPTSPAVPISKPVKKGSSGLGSSFASVAATSPLASSSLESSYAGPSTKSNTAFQLELSFEKIPECLSSDNNPTGLPGGSEEKAASSRTDTFTPSQPTGVRNKGRKIVIASTNAKRDFS